MANISEKYKAMKEKLNSLLEEHDLVYTFKTDAEPIVLEIRKNEEAKAEQLSLTADAKQKSSKDAKISFIFDGGAIIVNTGGDLFMTDALINKIKNIAKKLHYLFLHLYYVEHTTPERAKSEETEEQAAEA